MAMTNASTAYTDSPRDSKFEPIINAHWLARKKFYDQDVSSFIENIPASFAMNIPNSVVSRFLIFPAIVTTASKPSNCLSPFTNPPAINILTTASKPATASTVSADEDLLISFARKRITAPYSNKLADRLNYLYEVSVEEFPEQGLMSTKSLRGFIDFFASRPDLTEPELVLSPTGNICSEWHRLPNELFSVEFLPSLQVNYCVFASDPNTPSNINRSSGFVSADSLLKIIEPFKILSWIITKI